MKAQTDITSDDLRGMMQKALQDAGWSPDKIAGYLLAQEKSGWLRPQCPAWIRNSAAVYYCLPIAGSFDNPTPPTVTKRHTPKFGGGQ